MYQSIHPSIHHPSEHHSFIRPMPPPSHPIPKEEKDYKTRPAMHEEKEMRKKWKNGKEKKRKNSKTYQYPSLP